MLPMLMSQSSARRLTWALADEELANDDDSVDGQEDEVADDGDEEVADDGEDEGWELPEGWEAGTSTTTGETYYINTLNDERTWDRPTQTAAEVVAAAAESGLPAGWKCWGLTARTPPTQPAVALLRLNSMAQGNHGNTPQDVARGAPPEVAQESISGPTSNCCGNIWVVSRTARCRP